MTRQKKDLGKSKKGLDKLLLLWYNKYIKRTENLTNQKGIDTMDKKMTYVDALNIVLNGGEMTSEVIEKLTALRDVTAKRNSGGAKKPTKTQRENEEFKNAIYMAMEDGVQYTVSEVKESVAEVNGQSVQKITTLLTQMVKDGRVERTKDKRIVHFTKVIMAEE